MAGYVVFCTGGVGEGLSIAVIVVVCGDTNNGEQKGLTPLIP